MKEFKKWALRRLIPGTYRKMSLTKKIAFWLDAWCSYHYGAHMYCLMTNKKSPSQLEWALYEIPWYGKYISKLEFQFRYLTRPSSNIKGFFPFYYGVRENNHFSH